MMPYGFPISKATHPIYTLDDCVDKVCYFTTQARLAKLQTSSIDNCSDLTDPVCFRQTRINNHFFKVRLVIIFHSSLIIAMVYVWHRTVRLLSCFFVLFLITLILFGTDVIFYVDQPFVIRTVVCYCVILTFPSLIIYLSIDNEDPLSVLCGYDRLADGLHEFLQNDNSKRACFYRWAKKMMKVWNIEEEKLIISVIFVTIVSVVATIIFIIFPIAA
ncbi:hypothetical protein I4U23_027075 [Adineta vaga]|nr:hypothetical protein I4U23_027075 [Adineta vaga]